MCNYYIYDKESECFLGMSFADFEDAERYMMKLNEQNEEAFADGNRYDVYEKIT